MTFFNGHSPPLGRHQQQTEWRKLCETQDGTVVPPWTTPRSEFVSWTRVSRATFSFWFFFFESFFMWFCLLPADEQAGCQLLTWSESAARHGRVALDCREWFLSRRRR